MHIDMRSRKLIDVILSKWKIMQKQKCFIPAHVLAIYSDTLFI